MEEKKSFWASLPVLLTGIAAMITALTGLYVAFQNNDNPSPSQSAVAMPAQPSSTVARQPSPPVTSEPAPVSMTDSAFSDLRRLVAHQCDISAESIDVYAPLKTQRCSELDILEIVLTIEEKYKVTAPGSQNLDRVSVNSLAQIVHAR